MIYSAGVNVPYYTELVYDDGSKFDHQHVAHIDTDKAQILKYKKGANGKLKEVNGKLELHTVKFSKIKVDRVEFPTKFIITK